MVVPRTVDLGDFAVRRALPSAQSRMVGPFIFFDHFGPAEFGSGHGLDVRPHPHIGLATVTYLFDGEIMHRDSLGVVAPIRPGEVNWMTAGRGIVHSERSAPNATPPWGSATRFADAGSRCPPRRRKWIRSLSIMPSVISRSQPTTARACGSSSDRIYGQRSPLRTTSEMVFADATLKAGATLPVDASHEERALYLVSGEIDVMGDRFGPHTLLVLRPGDPISVKAVVDVASGDRGRCADGRAAPYLVELRFVAQGAYRRRQDGVAKRTFSAVPGDTEFIPLPAHDTPPQIM